MYELFGFSRTAAGDQIQLFVPDNLVDPTQYIRGGPSRIAEVRIVSDFQDRVNGGGLVWDYPSGLVMRQLPTPMVFSIRTNFLTRCPMAIINISTW